MVENILEPYSTLVTACSRVFTFCEEMTCSPGRNWSAIVFRQYDGSRPHLSNGCVTPMSAASTVLHEFDRC